MEHWTGWLYCHYRGFGRERDWTAFFSINIRYVFFELPLIEKLSGCNNRDNAFINKKASIKHGGVVKNFKIAIIGYGEVGKIFSSGLIGQSNVDQVSSWDLKFIDPLLSKVELDHAKQAGVLAKLDIEEACSEADLVISAVTASNTLTVAKEAASYMKEGSIFLDLNSASPGTKKEAALEIEKHGSSYVEAGVMTSVPPYGLKVPMLLGGEKAQELSELMTSWGMDTKAISIKLGVASAIKMSRSIMIKGMESLVIEAYSTARFYGVEEYVLPTLVETFPQIDWSEQGAYFFSRVVQHGKRRSEEMREAARTVSETGAPSLMASAIADKQAWVAKLSSQGVFKGLSKKSKWQEYADALLAHIKVGH